MKLKKLSSYGLPQAAVRAIQKDMIEMGFLELPGPPLGLGGPKTESGWFRFNGKSGPDAADPPDSQLLVHLTMDTAERFVGLREVRPNARWDDPSTDGEDAALSNELRALMQPSPWKDGWAYCAAFAEGVVMEALRLGDFSVETQSRFSELMSPHCVTSANNFGRIDLLREEPAIGSIWLGRWGSGSSGHCGLVRSIDGPMMGTIEANTSGGEEAAEFTAKDREGDWIDRKRRHINRNGNLQTLGFVHLEDIAKLS